MVLLFWMRREAVIALESKNMTARQHLHMDVDGTRGIDNKQWKLITLCGRTLHDKRGAWRTSCRPWCHVYCPSETQDYLVFACAALSDAYEHYFQKGPLEVATVNADMSTPAFNMCTQMWPSAYFGCCWVHRYLGAMKAFYTKASGTQKEKEIFKVGWPCRSDSLVSVSPACLCVCVCVSFGFPSVPVTFSYVAL